MNYSKLSMHQTYWGKLGSIKPKVWLIRNILPSTPTWEFWCMINLTTLSFPMLLVFYPSLSKPIAASRLDIVAPMLWWKPFGLLYNLGHSLWAIKFSLGLFLFLALLIFVSCFFFSLLFPSPLPLWKRFGMRHCGPMLRCLRLQSDPTNFRLVFFYF